MSLSYLCRCVKTLDWTHHKSGHFIKDVFRSFLFRISNRKIKYLLKALVNSRLLLIVIEGK